MEFLKAGAKHSRRGFIAANRVGKSLTGAYEMVCHLTGVYPSWWEGKRFTKPVNAWIAGVTFQQVKEGIQEILFGSFAEPGTGLLPRDALVDHKGDVRGKGNLMLWTSRGVANCIETALINHASGGYSKVEFKAYEQGWLKYQGTKRQVIWLDEEPDDIRIYDECSTRTAGAEGEEGILYCTFTPLHGFSQVVLGFLPGGVVPKNGIHPDNQEKFVVKAGWRDVPHLSKKWMDQQKKEYSPNEIDARTKGDPAMGEGRILPIDESFVFVKPFEIPEYWPRAYGMDPGWHRTAVVWMAEDPSTKVRYVYAEYRHGKVVPVVHAQAIKARSGEEMNGAFDPSGGGRQSDGVMLIDFYRSLGLRVHESENAIIPSIARLLNQFESGSLKIFNTCETLREEMRMWKYDMNNPNKPAQKQKDDLIDALRYVEVIFDQIARPANADIDDNYDEDNKHSRINKTRDSLTGY